MVDVVSASNDIALIGGPAKINLSVDLGAQGQRGSQIFTGPGAPTDDGVTLPSPLYPNDLYINLAPSSNEYLYLYRYDLVDGIEQWVRTLRLIPNTALLNATVKFISGDAYTTIDIPGVGTLDLFGLYFPLSDYFQQEDLGLLEALDFNVIFSVHGDAPNAGSINVQEITPYLTLPGGGTVNLGSSYLYVTMTLAELSTDDYTTWSAVTGDRTVHFAATVAGRVQ